VGTIRTGVNGGRAELVVAAIQMSSSLGDPDGNRERGIGWLRRAAEEGAELAVLPELSVCGYAPGTRDDALRVAEPVPGPSVEAWAEVARDAGMIVVGGLAEREGDRCYNAAVAVSLDGSVTVYRKAHLFERERKVFDPGDTGFPVIDAPFGKLGVLICYDLRFPEALRTLVVRGAQVVAVPTAWVTLSGRRRDDHGVSMQAYCAQALASMNRVFMVCAAMVGRFRDTRFLGNSLVTDVTGWPLAGPADEKSERLVLATVDPTLALSKAITPENDLLADRRPELYETEGAGSPKPFAPNGVGA
jgi:predicted amidohydrolase